jgi:thiol-disulfide isomerase/thioredoxin
LSAFLGCTEEGPATDVLDLEGNEKPVVLVFVRGDCPISNRYAPLLERLHREFDVDFWLVYPDPSETRESIGAHRAEYGLTIPALRDPEHRLVAAAGVTVTPEAAVFGAGGRLLYRGRIDDRFPSYGVSREPATAELESTLASITAGEEVEPFFREAVGCFISDLE